jgi:hypothetical protein
LGALASGTRMTRSSGSWAKAKAAIKAEKHAITVFMWMGVLSRTFVHLGKGFVKTVQGFVLLG